MQNIPTVTVTKGVSYITVWAAIVVTAVATLGNLIELMQHQRARWKITKSPSSMSVFYIDILGEKAGITLQI